MSQMADLSPMIGSLSAALAIFVSLGVFAFQVRRDYKLKKLDVYQSVELESNTLFRFEALHNEDIAPFLLNRRPKGLASNADTAFIDSYLFQALNLFEVTVTYRRKDLIDKRAFGSWVSWYFELLNSWYFRETWPERRLHYTPDLRAIFDPAVRNFDDAKQPFADRGRFFRHVGKLLNCSIIVSWLELAGTDGKDASA